MGPDLGRVAGDEDRDIAEDPDADIGGMFPERSPLPVEEELDKDFATDLVLVVGPPPVELVRVVHGEVGWPLVPGCAVMSSLERGKERIVVEPDFVG